MAVNEAIYLEVGSDFKNKNIRIHFVTSRSWYCKSCKPAILKSVTKFIENTYRSKELTPSQVFPVNFTAF